MKKKNTARRRLTAVLLTGILVLVMSALAGCQAQKPPVESVDRPTQEATQTPGEATMPSIQTEETPSEPTDPAATEPISPEETPTVPETSAEVSAPETEPETQPPVEHMYVMDFDALEGMDLGAFFYRPSYCEATLVDDAEEGKVVALTTTKIAAAGSVTPSVYIKYQAIAEAMGAAAGGTVLDSTERPCLVLKVKADGLWFKTTQLVGCKSLHDSGDGQTPLMTSVRGDGWEYLCFDFSAYTTKIAMLRLSPEILAGEDGERLLISEMRLCTAREAADYTTLNAYPVPERTAEDGYTLKILQFNIQTENGNSAPIAVRAAMFRELLDEMQPDSVGMEEVTVNWRHWLDTYVFNGCYVGVGENRSVGNDESCPIYYRADIYDLVDSGTFWLSETPDVPGSKLSGANYPRICTWVILRDKVTGREYVHLNTHLDHNGSNTSSEGNNIRKEQVKVLLSFVQTLGDRPMVLTGDFNSNRLTSENKEYALYKYITGKSSFETADGVTVTGAFGDTRLDATVTVDENHTATMVKYYDPDNAAYNPSRQPIDYAFYTAKYLTAESYQTFIVNRGSYYLSDHLAVLCTYAIW